MKKRLLTGLIAAALLLQPYAAGAESAPLVERLTKEETANDKAYLREAKKIDQQIEEMTVFLLSLEIT